MWNSIRTAAGTFARTMKRRNTLLALAATAGIGLTTPGSAIAHPHDDVRVGVVVRGGPECRRWVEPVCEDRSVKVWVEPAYRTVCDEVYVKPTYQTVCDRCWVEPVYQTQCTRVLVPEVCQTREHMSFDGRQRVCSRETVVVSPAHYESREVRVCVAEGHWQKLERQVCVTEGHYRHVERQELVTPGHFELRNERVTLVPGHWDTYASAGLDLRLRN